MKFISFSASILISAILSSTAAHANTGLYYCSTNSEEVEFKLVVKDDVLFKLTTSYATIKNPPPIELHTDGTKRYQVVISDYNDTVTSAEFDVVNNQITNKQLFSSGHDSDNYTGSLIASGNLAFTCLFEDK